MIIYDTLEKMFRKYLRKEKELEYFVSRRNYGEFECVISLKIWRLVKMEKWCLRSLYIESWSEWELSRSKVSGKSPSVGCAIHRWMCETARRLEHLTMLCEPWNVSSKSKTCELSTHMCELKNRVILCHESQNPIFSPPTKGKNQSFEGIL